MGCLFWTDFDQDLSKFFTPHPSNSDGEPEIRDDLTNTVQNRLVLFLIQYRKFINYFVEQSLINGFWGHYPQDVVAISSILIARFEMREILQVRWKKKQIDLTNQFVMRSTWNDNFMVFINQSPKFSLKILEECCSKIYSTVYNGADFPFEDEVAANFRRCKAEKTNYEIMIHHNNLN